jgi:ribosomal protein L25 (general stress protein Ctc)
VKPFLNTPLICLKLEGYVPGVIYGKDENKRTVSIRIMVPVKPLNKQIRDMRFSFENTIQRLQLDDNTEYLVTPRQLQVDPSE